MQNAWCSIRKSWLILNFITPVDKYMCIVGNGWGQGKTEKGAGLLGNTSITATIQNESQSISIKYVPCVGWSKPISNNEAVLFCLLCPGVGECECDLWLAREQVLPAMSTSLARLKDFLLLTLCISIICKKQATGVGECECDLWLAREQVLPAMSSLAILKDFLLITLCISIICKKQATGVGECECDLWLAREQVLPAMSTSLARLKDFLLLTLCISIICK